MEHLPMHHRTLRPRRILSALPPYGHYAPQSKAGHRPSPDELVIKQRGRKSVPVNWSPDVKHPGHKALKSMAIKPLNFPPSQKLGDSILKSKYKKRLFFDLDDSFGKKTSSLVKQPTNKSNKKNYTISHSVTNERKIAFTPEKIDFSDMKTPEKFKVDNLIEKKRVVKFNLNARMLLMKPSGQLPENAGQQAGASTDTV